MGRASSSQDPIEQKTSSSGGGQKQMGVSYYKNFMKYSTLLIRNSNDNMRM